jgi:hypothetical protein
MANDDAPQLTPEQLAAKRVVYHHALGDLASKAGAFAQAIIRLSVIARQLEDSEDPVAVEQMVYCKRVLAGAVVAVPGILEIFPKEV